MKYGSPFHDGGKNGRKIRLPWQPLKLTRASGQIPTGTGKVGIFAVMQTLRTPDERFAEIPNFPYSPHYCELDDDEGGHLRVAWVDEGPTHAEPILLLHGEPTWSFLYRKMIPVLTAAGHRVVCPPDLVGFGRSDKPTRREDHTYARHVEWMRALAFDVLDLQRVTLFGQDWGRADRVAAGGRERGSVRAHRRRQHGGAADRRLQYARGVVAVPPGHPGGAEHRRGSIRRVGLSATDHRRRPRGLQRAVPPTTVFSAGPRAMPGLVPTSPDDPRVRG